MSDKSEKAYLLPDVVDPPDDVCIRVFVPNDPAYIGAFWGSYQYLCQWTAWERDEAHTAKDVAARMRQSFDHARELWQAALGECGVIDVRQNTETPCTLEKTDDGTTWQAWADLLLCGAQIAPTPWPDGRGGETPAEAASDDMVDYWRGVAVEINDHLALSEDCPDFAYDVSGRVLQQVGVWMLSQIIALCAEMAAHTPEERAAALDADNFLPARDAALCATIDAGEDPVTDNRSFLEVWSDALGAWLTESSDWLMQQLAGAAAALGSQASQGWSRAAWSDAGGGAGFGWSDPACTWSHTFDFTIDGQAWTLVNRGGGFPYRGEYIANVGWQETYGANIYGGYRILCISRTFGITTRITRLTLNYNPALTECTIGCTGSGYPINDTSDVYAGADCTGTLHRSETLEGATQLVQDVDEDIAGISIEIEVGWRSDGNDPGGHVMLVSATIEGIGEEPIW